MAKKTTFFCKECGYETSGWMGKCPGCGMFNTFVEAPSEKAPAKAKTDSPAFTANQYSWQDGARAHYSVSREVPRSVWKCGKYLYSQILTCSAFCSF